MTETPGEAAKRLLQCYIRQGFQFWSEHAYNDVSGQPIYWRPRLKHRDGRKIIRPMRLNGHGYELREPAFTGKKPLYALDRISGNPNAEVWVFEGEQKADALNRLGLVGTTSGSASSGARTDWEPLRNRSIVIFPDNDEAGMGYAGEVGNILLGKGCSVSCVDVGKLGLATGGDVMDWLEAHPGAGAAQLEGLPKQVARSTTTSGADSNRPGPEVELRRGDAIRPEPVRWLWDGWLARGKPHVLAGSPGSAKTTLAMAFAATVSSGGCWPDGSRAEASAVLIWSGEDDPSDTLVPRLRAMGADMSRIHFVGDVRDGRDGAQDRSFDPSSDLSILVKAAEAIGGASLLVVDPLVSVVSGDSHKNAETRRALQALVDLATQLDCAVLGITHFTKGTSSREPVERVTGSLAFGAVARVVLVAAKTTATNEKSDSVQHARVLMRAKCNLGPDHGGFSFDLQQIEVDGFPGLYASQILWGAAIEGTARDVLADIEADPADVAKKSAVEDAKAFLLEMLKDGPVPSNDVFRDGSNNGHQKRTIFRAKQALGVRSRKNGFDGGWVWELPSTNNANNQQECHAI